MPANRPTRRNFLGAFAQEMPYFASKWLMDPDAQARRSDPARQVDQQPLYARPRPPFRVSCAGNLLEICPRHQVVIRRYPYRTTCR
jgi:hypothetical protein